MASTAHKLRWLLALSATIFLAVQLRMFVSQTDFSGRIAICLERETYWENVAKNLKQNMTIMEEENVKLRKQLEGSNKLSDENSRRFDLATGNNVADSSPVKEKETNAEALSLSRFEESKVVAAVVVIACNRGDYLERTLDSVLKYHKPSTGKFPLFISQDGQDKAVQEKAHSYPQFLYLQHIESAPPTLQSPGENIGYYRIAEHYKFALSQLFDVLGFPRVIILEDDMELAPDFFDYFEATSELLDKDESILAISSWNDNGQKQFVEDPEAVHRSDFFPGLGWMLRRSLWNELSPKWPKAYWDDWLRLNANRKNRHSIRPEICRTFNFGKHGTSGGQFFNEYLASIRLNDKMVDWRSKDLSTLLNVNYSRLFWESLKRAKREESVERVAARETLSEDVFLEYENEQQFQYIASQFGIFQDWKDGVPRTAYQGVVVFRFRGGKVYLGTKDTH